jgi:Flp pilus assembly protein TadD
MREGDFFNAIQYGKLAISHNPSDARYYFMVAACQARNPEARWQRLAEENYTKATELDPWNAEYWISLGRLYKRRGLKLRARKQFEEALKLVPNNTEILQELHGLD